MTAIMRSAAQLTFTFLQLYFVLFNSKVIEGYFAGVCIVYFMYGSLYAYVGRLTCSLMYWRTLCCTACPHVYHLLHFTIAHAHIYPLTHVTLSYTNPFVHMDYTNPTILPSTTLIHSCSHLYTISYTLVHHLIHACMYNFIHISTSYCRPFHAHLYTIQYITSHTHLNNISYTLVHLIVHSVTHACTVYTLVHACTPYCTPLVSLTDVYPQTPSVCSLRPDAHRRYERLRLDTSRRRGDRQRVVAVAT